MGAEHSEAKPSHWGKMVFFLALIAIGAGILAWMNYSQKRAAAAKAQVAATTVQTTHVTRGNLEMRVRLTGNTSARIFANITAPKLTSPDGGGQMTIMTMVKSGSVVKKDQSLIEMDAQSAKDHLEDTIDGLKDKENDVKKKIVANELSMTNFQQSLAVAKANLDKAKLDFQALDIRTEVDKELVRLAVEEADATYKELLTDLPRRQESLRCDLRIAELAKKTEDLHVSRHQVDLTRLTIKSPMDGMAVVLSQPRGMGDTMTYGEGDRVFPGAPIMKVIDQKSMQVEAAINQAESSMFRLGQTARVQLDAFPGAEYQGRIYAIGALAVSPGRQTNYLRTVPVRIQILNPDGKTIPDLSASADVLIDKAENALIVPASALRRENGKNYVQVKNGENWERRVVLTGLSNGTQTVVTDGLKEGETIRASYN